MLKCLIIVPTQNILLNVEVKEVMMVEEEEEVGHNFNIIMLHNTNIVYITYTYIPQLQCNNNYIAFYVDGDKEIIIIVGSVFGVIAAIIGVSAIVVVIVIIICFRNRGHHERA